MSSRRSASMSMLRRAPRYPELHLAAVSQLPPLPASSIDYWHSELQLTPAAWVSQMGARSLPGVNTPVVAADGGFFNGRTVAQSALTGGKAWLGTGLSTIAAAGTRPWLYCVGRARTLGAGGRSMVATNGSNAIRYFVGDFRCLWNSAGSQASTFPVDTSHHRFSTWVDAVAGTAIRVDSTQNASAGYTSAIAVDITAVAVGQNTAGAEIGDVSVAFFLICSAVPSGGEMTALEAWSLAYWGV